MSHIKRALLAATMAVSAAATAVIAPAGAATLDAAAHAAIQAALEDEHKAEAFYAAVMEKFGEVRPFSNIIRAEQKHASALNRLLQTYGQEQTVDNPYLGSAEVAAAVPATLAEACRMGVDAEIANRELYDTKLIPAAQDYAEIKSVFSALRDASENRHLPAFERCGSGQGQGHGMGMGMGAGMGMGHGNNAGDL
ncbi:ferritin-like domain-containing protein [Rhizobium terricola]|nr:DUF2202 domain-containing protein [Rhizobium terricola]